MRHFPVFLDLDERRVIVSGAGNCAVSKIRLILKTSARIEVYGVEPVGQIGIWALEGRLAYKERPLQPSDVAGATLLYCANDDASEDARAAEIGKSEGALVNIVDNLNDSEFITPAIVDRDPVTVAICTEGTAPVLARKIKSDLEEMLPAYLGRLARIGQAFRSRATALPSGQKRRRFWSRFYGLDGFNAFSTGGRDAAHDSLERLLVESGSESPEVGRVLITGAGPGDPDLMTMKARRALDTADVVLHDRLVPQPILELARREAEIIDVGKTCAGKSWEQEDINSMIIDRARAGDLVVRLKSGDPAVFGRLDEEAAALDAAGLDWEIIPGVTAASAAASVIGRSLTCRGRNSGVTLVTGHGAIGFAEHDWRALARPGAVAAIYMGRRAATFIRGRLLMHGAVEGTPVTVIENVSHESQKVVSTTVLELPEALQRHGIDGPAVLMLGLLPHSIDVQKSIDSPIAEAIQQ